jgi:DNA-directed RNA polymerase specialized sigma24 family protein
MILLPEDLVKTAIRQLPIELRHVVEDHVYEGLSVWAIARRRRTQIQCVESSLALAFAEMRTALMRKGVNSLSDAL